MKQILTLFLLSPTLLFAQVSGTVTDRDNKEPMFGSKVIASNGQKQLTDVNGNFTVPTTETDFPLTILISMQGYITDTLKCDKPGNYEVVLGTPLQQISTVVVSSSRRSQEIEEVPISMEIIKPDLINNKGITDLEDAVDQSPGVFTMDGQVSIRGGSGFSYGAGSRVMLLWNGMPLLSGEAGDAKWTSVPMEAASQIEIMKGASSVLYGSGALNGIISLTEREPGLKGELRAKYQSGVYGNPKRSSLKWWNTNPWFHQADVYYGKMYKNVGFTVAAQGIRDGGFRQGEDDLRGRVAGTFYIRPKKINRLKAGIGYNVQFQEGGNFIIWESDSLGYSPSGGPNPADSGSTLSIYNGKRISIDPYIKYIDKYNNKHSLKTRYYYTDNQNAFNPSQNSTGGVTYADYQFQRTSRYGYVLTTGASVIHNSVNATLFGNHTSINPAVYIQYEQNFFEKLDLVAGARAEYFEQDGMRGDSDFYFGKDSTKLPVYPIYRLGAHYKLLKFTHLRASFGQGVRYPSVAERYTTANIGALNIFANPNLRPERGWAAEIGVKQGVKIGSNWKGFLDVAGFINQYNDMMEFTFGIYNPDSINLSPFPGTPGYVLNWVGFQAQNAESARISGVEFSFASGGKIGDVELQTLIGYTYMNPISQNTDYDYISKFSSYRDTITGNSTDGYDTTVLEFNNMLKYRFNHLAKADIEATWKGISVGASMRYNSHMVNIDKVFEDEVFDGIYILPGLKDYRKIYNKGNLVFDARLGYTFKEHYRLGFIVNNVLNNEYSSRPGDIQPPRTFIMQLQAKF